MLIIAELFLTVAAWRKGWKWMALLPGGIAFALALVLGIYLDLAGVSKTQIHQITLALLPLDFIVIGVLGFMTAKGRKDLKVKEAAAPSQGVPVASN